VLGDELAARRMALGLSTRELAAQTGLDHTTIVRLEKGERQPTVPTLQVIASVLACQFIINQDLARLVPA
jgi:transcriptional regulator with XRE-family HTH domain